MRLFGRRETPAQLALTDLAPLVLTAIGIVRSPIQDPRRATDSAAECEIELAGALESALAGLDGFSHLIVVCWLDRVSDAERAILSERPGGNPALPELGVLALRTHHRPNPIGVTVVRLLTLDGVRLRVRGLDAVDGTPVLDIKPYVPFYDSEPDARLPRWALGEPDA